MAAVATLSQRMEYLIDQARSKRIVDHDLLSQIFIEVGQLEAPLEARLVEEFQNSLDINEILEEFLNQSLIWVDDVCGCGKLPPIFVLKVISLQVEEVNSATAVKVIIYGIDVGMSNS